METLKHIVITGATGFVGKQLVPYLKERNCSVQTISLRLADWQQQLDKDAQAIIHLAGKAHDTKNTSAAAEYFHINTDLTISLFQWFLKSDVRDFIYFSSVKAAADSVNDILTEGIVPQPQTPYGQSKRKAEEYLLAQQLPIGKRLFIIRPCMIHGAGNKGNLNLLYKFVAKGIPYPLAAFENKRSFLSVNNLCFVLAALIEKSDVPSGIYNVADDDALSTNEVVSIISETMNLKPGLWAVPRGLLQAAARLGDILKLPLNSERLKKLTENYVVSNAKIKQVLGITQLPISARQGLQQTIKSFLSK